jgi:RimJ/RimL family protein N-acetyltransferase
MPLISLHDKAAIAAFCRRHPALYIYELGDLDDFFWPHTTWYGWEEQGVLRQLALLYHDMTTPVLLAHAAGDHDGLRRLLGGVLPLLPRRIYAHLDAGAIAALVGAYRAEPHGPHLKMDLRDPSALAGYPATAEQLSEADLPDIEALYAASYPGNWFVPRMLQTGCYYGIRSDGALVCIAGVHVFAPAQGVAALGNVTTHPAWRGRGLAAAACAALCRALLARGVATIGLNVRADNAAAIACYQKLGFRRTAAYDEWMLEAHG